MLINLKLSAFFILPRSWAIFRKWKVNLSKIIGPKSFCLQLSRAKEDVTQNSVTAYEINKGSIDA